MIFSLPFPPVSSDSRTTPRRTLAKHRLSRDLPGWCPPVERSVRPPTVAVLHELCKSFPNTWSIAHPGIVKTDGNESAPRPAHDRRLPTAPENRSKDSFVHRFAVIATSPRTSRSSPDCTRRPRTPAEAWVFRVADRRSLDDRNRVSVAVTRRSGLDRTHVGTRAAFVGLPLGRSLRFGRAARARSPSNRSAIGYHRPV